MIKKASYAPSTAILLLLILTVWAGAGCARDAFDNSGETHSISLAMSMGNVQPTTKMTGDITQNGGVFRGVEHIWMVPFATEDSQEVAPGDSRLGGTNVSLGTRGINSGDIVANNNAHLFRSAFVPTGMNRVLTYGKAPDGGQDASKESKHRYGVLNQNGIDDPSGSDDITFSLESVLLSGDADELSEARNTADGLLEELNVIMSLLGSSQNASILNIFDAVKRENKILACSYPTFDQLRNEIQTALLRIPFESMDLIDEISRVSQAVSAFSAALAAAGSDFPVAYGIPEGSFGFWWNGKEFTRLINGVNISLVDPASYCYPPELWYYTNSPIQTSEDEEVRNEYVSTNLTWDDILVHYDGGDRVNMLTQSVAVTNPLQYGIALLDLCLALPGDEAASLVSDCPLTGIIVGDQKDVDFRFVPAVGPSRYVYDNVIDGVLKIGATGDHTQTLVLESARDATVHFALEFRNNTGYIRSCQQGDILPRCKFYIAGELEAPSGGSVFSKDHKTTLTVRVNSLRNAYTTVPDLHSPQLEIGLVAEMKWNQITPQSIVLDY